MTPSMTAKTIANATRIVSTQIAPRTASASRSAVIRKVPASSSSGAHSSPAIAGQTLRQPQFVQGRKLIDQSAKRPIVGHVSSGPSVVYR